LAITLAHAAPATPIFGQPRFPKISSQSPTPLTTSKISEAINTGRVQANPPNTALAIAAGPASSKAKMNTRP